MLSLVRRKRRDLPRCSSTTTSNEPPFPWPQLSVLALCRLCEPIAFMSIFPYVYFMVRDFGVTDDERKIAFYAGMVTSAFTFGEFSTGILWGRISDRIGRKYVLLMGMFGTGLSMLLFGLSRSLPMAIVARTLGGLLNGNLGVLQTTVAEVTTVKAHQPRAFSIIPSVWCIGSIIGAGLGGSLAEPVKNYPAWFTPGSLWETFPFLLPNLFCLVFVFVGLTAGILFLEETHEDHKHRRDRGVELGRLLLSRLRRQQRIQLTDKDSSLDETESLISDEDEPLAYDSPASDEEAYTKRHPSLAHRPSASQTFTPQVILNLVAVGILAFHTISFEQLLLILLASPKAQAPPQLPFKFEGGFALTSQEIGFILSVQGFLQMFVQFIIFPIVSNKLGRLNTFRLVILAYPLLYVLAPYLTLLPDTFKMPCVYLVVVWKVVAQCFSYPSAAMMLANMAPKRALGTVNGVSATSMTLCRTIGPLFSGAIQSAGSTAGYSGLSWWSIAVVAAVGAVECMWMKGSKPTESPAEPVRRRHSMAHDDDLDNAADSDSEGTVCDEARLSESDDGTLCNTPSMRESMENAPLPKDLEENLLSLLDEQRSS